MATSLYDTPAYSNKHSHLTGIGENDDVNYDAMKVAQSKFRQNPERYTADSRINDNGESYNNGSRQRRPYERTEVVIEHWSGCVGQGVCDRLRYEIELNFPDVKFTEFRGRTDSFEVFVNGKLLYSRIMQGGYPYEEEVLEAVWRARQGKTIYQIDRFTKSSICTIL